MKRFIIYNKEVFIVSTLIEAESEEEALEAWSNDEGEEIDIEYLCDLSDYTKFSSPFAQEIKEV